MPPTVKIHKDKDGSDTNRRTMILNDDGTKIYWLKDSEADIVMQFGPTLEEIKRDPIRYIRGGEFWRPCMLILQGLEEKANHTAATPEDDAEWVTKHKI